jgi:ERCC4-related helicase
MAQATALYLAGFRPLVAELVSLRVVAGSDEFAFLSSAYAFVRARQALQANGALAAALGPRMGRVQQLLSACQMLARGLDMMHTGGIRPALEYLLASKDTLGPTMERSVPLKEALRLMETSSAGGDAASPKLQELAKVLRQHFAAAADAAQGGAGAGGAAAAPAETRAIVFTSSRESVKHVMEELAELRSYGVIASEFIGQARPRRLPVLRVRRS